jgi:hypothetical protein
VADTEAGSPFGSTFTDSAPSLGTLVVIANVMKINVYEDRGLLVGRLGARADEADTTQYANRFLKGLCVIRRLLQI